MQTKVHKLANADRHNSAKVTTACGVTAYIDGSVSGEMVTAFGYRYQYADNRQNVTCEKCLRFSAKPNT